MSQTRWSMPFMMVDLNNFQVITSATIPEGQIKDSKSIVVSETPIPGLNFHPIMSGGGGNRKISFTLPIVRRNDGMGNLAMLKQFDGLRNQANLGGVGIFSKTKGFIPNPKVLFYWGTGSIPLVWYVTKCDFSHTSGMVNASAYPQHTLVDMELTLDESNLIYKGEELFRSVTALLGNVEAVGNMGPAANRGRDLISGSMF